MKLVVSNDEVCKGLEDEFSSISPDMPTFMKKAQRLIGSNLSAWMENAEVTEADTWEKMQMSALELHSWQTGKVSPLAPRFVQQVQKLGPQAVYDAGFLLSMLCAESQIVLRNAARNARWDGGHRPQGDALGVAIRRAA